ncbi:MAG TPA: DUF3365 domain-containing protein [Candidatus Kapabacteria bacterium]|jgi:mono/diheme cytochrome c family protein|nr:DUF3365 domain-containing protein [Candidatus Kapabacteria bacterium]
MNTFAFYLTFISLIYSLNHLNHDKTPENIKQTINNDKVREGFVLLEQTCFSCHSPNASMDNNIAPTIAAIKTSYMTQNPSLEEFTNDLTTFLTNPSVETSKMPDAITKYNLMPTMNIHKEQIASIAAYMYYTPIEKPEWGNKEYQEEKQKYRSHSDISPLEMGENIAIQTKSILGKNLLNAINSLGVENALSFCSLKAIPITDSMALALKATIKRVSDKNRNPNNKANTEELAYIASIKEAMTKKLPIKPQLTSINNTSIGYYPILTNTMCLQCHGEYSKDINPKTFAKITSLYPDDKATGYKVDELRGIWVIKMNQK